MPDYSTDNYETALGKLTGYGKKIGAYHQGDYRTKMGVRSLPDGRTTFRDTVGGKPLGSGYCAGVCLDWIRRVLMSSPDREQGYLTYYYEEIEAGKTVHGRTNLAAKERAFQTTGRMAQAYFQTNDTTWTRPGNAPANAPYKVEDKEFRAVAKVLDETFDEDRDAVRRKKSKKRFSNLVVASSDMRTYDTPGRWMGALLERALVPGAAAQLGFNKSGQSGHAVAVWSRMNGATPGELYFFDPNYGVFSYDKDGLQDALQYLFWKDDEDTPHYASCASEDAQVMSYVVYNKAS